MNKFALLFEIDSDNQVLVYKEYLNASDETIVHNITDINGIIIDAKFTFTGEEQENNANRYMQSYTRKQAETFYNKMKVVLEETEKETDE